MTDHQNSFDSLSLESFHNATIFLDVDGTLVADKGSDLDIPFIEKIKKLSQENKVYLCSNGSVKRGEKFAQLAGVSAIAAHKPFVGSAKSFISADSRTVVIGDKYLTDGIFAHSLGAEFIKIDHIRSKTDSFYPRFAYALDDLVWKIIPYIAFLRPSQWVKNILVFAPVFFASAAFSSALAYKALLAAIIFSITASAMYALNDMFDIEQDKLHPVKKFRPLASGRMGMGTARVFFVILLGLVLWGLSFIPSIIPVIVAYVVLNFLYSFFVKHVAVLDLTFVAFFYVLRVLAGGLATSTYISPWIILCVLFGSLFVISGKRRGEYIRSARRKVLEMYSHEALDFIFGISAGLAIITYGIWSVLEHNSPYLVYSTIFVIIALFRLLNKSYLEPEAAESPEILVFKDPWILGAFVSWAVYIFVIFYTVH